MSRRLPVSRRSGQALVEFALVLPLLLALLIGIVELGQAWRSSQVVTHAAREGGRLASVQNSTPAAVEQRVRERLTEGRLDAGAAVLTLRVSNATGTADTVTVRYPYAFRYLRPVVGLIAPDGAALPPGSIEIVSTFVTRNE